MFVMQNYIIYSNIVSQTDINLEKMKKLALVTGGTKGIGRAIVEKFALNDFNIITCARNSGELEALEKEVKQINNSVSINYMQADLSKKEDAKRFIDFINKTRQPVDLLVNNTGVFIPGQIHQEEEGVLEHLIQTNLYSAYHLTRGVVGKMIERKSGSIFNICSTASITPYVNGGSYCISKYALLGMTKVLREELKPYNIRVTAVLPGATLTASWDGIDLPEERFIKASDIADAIWGAYNLSTNAVVEELLIRPQLGDIE